METPLSANHAYRPDLADTALAGAVIASHYAEPLARPLTASANALATPAADGDVLVLLVKGDVLRMLDCSRGWAWGYIPDGRVGYVPAAALGF